MTDLPVGWNKEHQLSQENQSTPTGSWGNARPFTGEKAIVWEKNFNQLFLNNLSAKTTKYICRSTESKHTEHGLQDLSAGTDRWDWKKQLIVYSHILYFQEARATARTTEFWCLNTGKMRSMHVIQHTAYHLLQLQPHASLLTLRSWKVILTEMRLRNNPVFWKHKALQ